ncbi:hypothetical protein COY17_03745 [Candidatus Saccharibacteria bacterium CG_4_10_14_0_2_um_filter_52_9]|nr:MAG: hypothetical protein COY17_03745 [Candidatus Saccharibacteria bacterium CG_4_10_14_0_2_um_filter_52_9]
MEVKQQPAMDVVAPPPQQADPADPPQSAKPEPAKPHHEDKKAPKPKAEPKPHNNNVIAAIFATVIIVLGLAALTVLAYLKQTGKIG